MTEANPDPYASRLNELFRFLSRKDHGAYMFAILKHDGLWKPLSEWLGEQLQASGTELKVCHLFQDSDRYLVDQIAQYQSSSGRPNAILVNGLEADGPKRCGELLLELNFARELLLGLKTPILFLINEQSFPLVTRNALDLFSQRAKSLIEFSEAPSAGIIRNLNFDLILRVFDTGVIYDKMDLWEEEFSSLRDHGKDLFRKKYLGLHLCQLSAKLRLELRVERIVQAFPPAESEFEQIVLEVLPLIAKVWRGELSDFELFMAAHWERLNEEWSAAKALDGTSLKFWELLGDALFLTGELRKASTCYWQSLSSLDGAAAQFENTIASPIEVVLHNRSTKLAYCVALFSDDDTEFWKQGDKAEGLNMGIVQEILLSKSIFDGFFLGDDSYLAPMDILGAELEGNFQKVRQTRRELYQLNLANAKPETQEYGLQSAVLLADFFVRNGSLSEAVAALNKALEMLAQMPSVDYTDYFEKLQDQLAEKIRILRPGD